MNGTTVRVVSLLLSGAVLLLVPLPGRSQTISFTKVADTTTIIPGTTEPFIGFSIPSIDDGVVAFAGNGATTTGIYTSTAGSLITVVDNTTTVPDSTLLFTAFEAPSINSGDLAFVAAPTGIYKVVEGDIIKVVDTNTVIPGTSGTFLSFGKPSIDDDHVVFRGLNPFLSGGRDGIYLDNNGVLSTVADQTTAIPGQSGEFADFILSTAGADPLVEDGLVIFQGNNSAGQNGIYKSVGGTLSVVADVGDSIPASSFSFVGFAQHSLDETSVAFDGRGPSNFGGIYRNTGGSLDVVVDTNTTIPGQPFNFSPGSASVDANNIAFRAGSCPSCGFLGLFVASAGELINVVDNSQLLDSKSIVDLSLGPDGLNGDQIVFLVTFNDNSKGIYLATLVEGLDELILTAEKDSFLRRGSPDRNEGANPGLRLQAAGDNRVVVGFDQDTIDGFGSLTTATLVLTIAENANNWGRNDDRTVDAHPLTVDFAEGDGQNAGVPGAQSTRGNGPGVTWNCAADAEIANQQTDCDPRWNGGSFGPSTAAPVLHVNGLTGEVSWDVTDDVLAGTSAWLIKKTSERQPGRVSYHSKEGADDADDPELAPRLILEK